MASTRAIPTRTWGSVRRNRLPYQCRHFTQSTRCLVNPLVNLSHFSAAKEAQFLSRERNIPREEFHPYLQLIRSSEVDPFAPVPGASPSAIAALKRAKAGETDKETTYTLALSNLMSQVELAKRESFQVTSMLLRLQEKQQRDEKNALLFMLAAVGLLSLIMLKTRALEDLKDYAFTLGHEVSGSTSKPLSSPSARSSNPPRPSPVASDDKIQSCLRPQPSHNRSIHESTILLQPSSTVSSSPTPPTERGWTFSRLFWAR